MSRTTATALALVNWKGVFYERYLLDRHVTALEGANGAGKTTVMIAAYVVLLPDLVRLRFTNLGETAATGGDRGLYGRLGEPGRPSYAAMELALADGSSVVAGVQLVRKAEPNLDLVPFLVTGVRLEGSLKTILLRSTAEHDEVPELDAVRTAVVALGGRLQVFSSAKDYFAALFDRGINPLRLATDEERSKLHDMLRTSMTGGISRALTSELRSFLLKEESGLSDTLARMRANLDACRRTRAEVVEARALEHDISGVHAAGRAMFDARVAGMQAALGLARTARDRAVVATETVRDEVASLALAATAQAIERDRITTELASLRKRADEAAALRVRAVIAQAVRERLERTHAELGAATVAEAEATRLRDEARTARAAARDTKERARDAYERAARGLGDLQAGLDETHRRAHARKLARTQLDEARRLLATPELMASAVDGALRDARTRLAELDAVRARAARDEALAAVNREERAVARAALAQIRAGADGYDAARAELARLSELARVAARRPALDVELSHAEARAARRAELRSRAENAGLKLTVEDAPADLARAHAAAEDARREAEQTKRNAIAEQASAARLATAEDESARGLDAQTTRFRALAPALARVEAQAGARLRSADDVTRARDELVSAREAERAKAAASDVELRRREGEAAQLDHHAGLAPALLALREVLGAELLAARFEEIAPDAAPSLEAALGPLVHALVVADPALAAETLAAQPDAPATVWLVAEDDVVRLLAAAGTATGDAESIDVVVHERFGIRATRKPAHPVLGRAARAKRAAAEHDAAQTLAATIMTAHERARALDALVEDAARLLADVASLAAGDRSAEADDARARAETARTDQRAAAGRADTAEAAIVRACTRLATTQALVADAHWLAPPDAEGRVRELDVLVAEAASATAETARTANARELLALHVDALRTKDTPEESAADREHRERERDRLYAATLALEHVAANRDALAYEDLTTETDQGALRSTLEAQHAEARVAAGASEERLREADAAWEEANLTWQTLETRRSSLAETVTRLGEELTATGGEAAVAVDVEALDGELATLAADRDRLAAMEPDVGSTLAVTRERHTRASTTAATAATALEAASSALAPLEASFASFLALAEASRLVPTASDDAFGPAEYLADARAQRELLLARLDQVRGGTDGALAVRAAVTHGGDEATAYLEAWLAARAWAMRRLPAQLADAADPGAAIARLRTDLGELADRVLRQEQSLRGGSEDVARGIDLQLRKTAARVRRLNRDLEQVAFGSVGAVRIVVKRVERMELVLRALKSGAVQELLFQSAMPLEEALGEIFRRFGGGGRSGAAKVLDYREYVDLVVEIQRRGKTDWETASPTRLSTGEAIGVGAALMMVILTEWERDANLLRSDRPTGTLRFLFLDEANRLSPDNLVVLFDLCRLLDLQLLVAAPEVAHAAGNTTYRLVRHVDREGREEVLVSGRRAVAPLAETATPTSEVLTQPRLYEPSRLRRDEARAIDPQDGVGEPHRHEPAADARGEGPVEVATTASGSERFEHRRVGEGDGLERPPAGDEERLTELDVRVRREPVPVERVLETTDAADRAEE